MSSRAPRYSIILAAGKGTRMGSINRNKVCFPIDGKPAINRAIDTYNACGVRQHILVVGAFADDVLKTVGTEYDNVMFAYQAEQLGTAHAAQMGLKALEGLESEQDVLLVAGDRIIKSTILEQFFDLYFSQHCDMALLSVPNRKESNQGRIVISKKGRPLGVIEAVDVCQRRVYRRLWEMATKGTIPPRKDLLQIIREGFTRTGTAPGDDKYEKAFGALWQALAMENRDLTHGDIQHLIPEEMTRFEFMDEAGNAVTKHPDEIEETPLLNTSVYLVKTSALRYALSKLDINNAQQEEYLSDMVTILANSMEQGTHRYRLANLSVKDPGDVLSFNDPAELLEVEARIQSKSEKSSLEEILPAVSYQTVSDWLKLLEGMEQQGRSAAEKVWDELSSLYSEAPEVISERIQALISLIKHTAEVVGSNEKVFIVRSPGRVNVMGRHIDAQGGTCNLMTIGYETLMAVKPREDDQVRLFSVDPQQFPDRQFSIGELVSELPWGDWLSLINSEKVSEMVHTYGGDWSQYIKAAVLRLQKKFHTHKLLGMDLVVSGNIPMAAGLSSSSSLVVGAAEATVTINRLDTFPAQLVDLCGEGEWFVGTRGGAADHAAVKFGQKGKVVKVTFFDFSILDIVPFPEDYVLAVCNSGVQAQKSGKARDLFNHRISCYRIGFLLIKKFFPQYASVLHHLRDVNMQTLNVPLSWIYKILLHLPEKATQNELLALLPEEDLDIFFSQHNPPPDGLYPIRGVVLFGLAEMERAKQYADAMKKGRIDFIGQLMNASHDGDRVIAIDPAGNESDYWATTSNGYILNLIEDLESGDITRVGRAQLHWQPGSYHCSLPEIDRMVHISLNTQGIVGAQLAGAGLGGCMMVMTHRSTIEALINNLTENYYKPHNKPPAILICQPVAGSDVLLQDIDQ